MTRTAYRSATSGLILSALLSFAGTQAAHAQTKDFNIAAQSATTGIPEFARQAGIQILASEPLVRGKRVAAVTGSHSVEEALAILLKGTGLVATSKDGATYTVAAPSPATGADAAKGGKKTSSEGFRVAQVDQGQTSSPSTVEEQDEQASKKKAVQLQEMTVHIPEILVVGSKSLDTDIRRTVDDPQPYVIFDRTQIEQSGAANVEDFLKNRLTMNTAAATRSQLGPASGGFSENRSQVNLRGLGTNQTLILIDGHRMSSLDERDETNPGQPNLNGIPLAAVERIEVLPTTASGIYGGSATGGVVNVILRRDYSGMEVKLTYDNTFDAASARRRVDMSSGFNLEGGKTNILLAGSYSEGNALTFQDRADLVRRGQAIILAHNGNNYRALDFVNPPFGATPNIETADGSNLVLKNGTALNSPVTYVPAGYAGTAGDGGAALVANAGKYNLDFAHSAQAFGGGDAALVNTPTVESLTATLRREFTPQVQAFLEGSASEMTAKNKISTAIFNSRLSLPVSAPNNPFQQAIRVAIPTASTDHDLETKSFDGQLVGGLIVKLPRDWKAEGDYTWSRSRFRLAQLGGLFLSPAGRTAVTTGAIDVLRDTNVYPVDFSSYLFGYYAPFTFLTTLKDATLRFGGPVGSLPAGAPQAALLLEHRDEILGSGVIANSLFGQRLFPSQTQAVDSAYAELRVPLVSERNKISGVRELELQLSGRWDGYTTRGANGNVPAGTPIVQTTNKVTSTNPTVALRYEPIQDLALRASYGTGFLPPAVNQLTPVLGTNGGFGAYTDPRRGNTPIDVFEELDGGNPNLRPEKSKSKSAGIILTPRIVPGLRLSVDYTKIEKTDNIAFFANSLGFDAAVQTLINDESLLPGRITRGPNLPGDLPGWAGPITFVDNTLLNIAKAEVEAYDIQVDYRKATGNLGAFDFFALTTSQTHYKTQDLASLPVLENVGVTSTNPVKFKGTAGLTWNYGQWTLGWNTRYFDSYWVNATHTFNVNQGSARIPSQIYHDAFATYRFGRSSSAHFGSQLLSNTEINLGIRNVFNAKPPFEAVNFATAYYSYFGDPRLASYYLSVRKSIQ